MHTGQIIAIALASALAPAIEIYFSKFMAYLHKQDNAIVKYLLLLNVW